MRDRKARYAGETQLASFCKLFDIHIYPVHNYQLLRGHWGQFRTSNQAILPSTPKLQGKYVNIIPPVSFNSRGDLSVNIGVEVHRHVIIQLNSILFVRRF